MELRQLRYFVAIAEAGSLSRASERLRVAQPALSMQLANLEAECGTQLFERTNRGVRLTASGALLLRHADTILRQVNEATQAIRSSADLTGQVSIGLPTTVSDAFVSALLQRVEAELPGVTLRVAEHMTASLGDMLADGALDLAILMNAPDQASVAMQPLLLESYCLAPRAARTWRGGTPSRCRSCCPAPAASCASCWRRRPCRWAAASR